VRQLHLPLLWHADGGYADCAFLGAVDVDYCVYVVVVEGADLACSEVQADGCQGEVLGDVSGVEIDIAVRPLALLPFTAFEYSGPDKDRRRCCAHALAEGRGSDLPPQVTLL